METSIQFLLCSWESNTPSAEEHHQSYKFENKLQRQHKCYSRFHCTCYHLSHSLSCDATDENEQTERYARRCTCGWKHLDVARCGKETDFITRLWIRMSTISWISKVHQNHHQMGCMYIVLKCWALDCSMCCSRMPLKKEMVKKCSGAGSTLYLSLKHQDVPTIPLKHFSLCISVTTPFHPDYRTSWYGSDLSTLMVSLGTILNVTSTWSTLIDYVRLR